jgi:hypothetical protein
MKSEYFQNWKPPTDFQAMLPLAETSSKFGKSHGFRRRMRNSLRLLRNVVLIALFCLIGLLAASWIRSQDAVELVRAHANAILQGQVESAYALFSSNYQAGTTLSMFRRWLRQQDPLSGNHNLRIWNRSVGRRRAILLGSFQDIRGRSYPVVYRLIRENGDWRIDSLQLSDSSSDSLPEEERFLYI